MNTVLSLIILMVLSLGASSSKDQKEVNWNSFSKGLEQSKASGKKMVVSVYTDWCSWCKKMEGSTFKDQKVVDLLKKKYVSVKLNAESKSQTKYQEQSYTEQQLSQAFGIKGYPATIFLDEKQNPITVVPGYIPAENFADILQYFGDDVYKSKTYEEYLKAKGKKLK